MGERTFPDPIYDDKFAASFGLPAGTKIIGPPMNDSLLTTRPDGQRGEVLRYKGPWPPPKEDEPDPQPVPPKPTAADPPPPEIVPRERQALAIVTSPDVCRSPNAAIPYQSWGMGFNDQEFSPNVRANGEIIKLQTSKFFCCYGDEPGVGLGVVSNTRGDVVEPVTSSTIVRANGQWVQRHTDTCTLNNGNAPGEYVNPKSEQTDKAPDGKDEQNKTRDEKIAEYAESKGWKRASDGGWNTNPGGVGWASNDKVGEEMDYVNSGRGNVQPFSMGSGPSEIKAYTPSWTENIEHSVQERLMSWGMDTYQAGEYGRKIGGLAGFVPGVGNGLSANDASRSFGSGQYLMGAIQSVGAVIGIGPGRLLTKGAEKGAEKVVQKQVEQAAAKALEEKAAKEAAERLAKEQAEAAAKKKAEEEAVARASGQNGVRATAASGSAEHKAARWREYKERGGEWDYERWSKSYDANMVRATQANAAVDAYHDTLGWGKREVTVTSTVDGVDHARRLDIADVASQRGVEYKTGYQTANQDNLWEVARDKALKDAGWDINWVFRDTASQPLKDALTNAGIPYKVGN